MMRLICPNCGAQYDVDSSVVPEGGRDVQCSNCGHTWFQRPAGQDTDLAQEQDSPEISDDHAGEETIPDDDHLTFSRDDEEQAETPPVDAPAEETPKRRELETGVSDILREEAERETAERVAEGSGLETQPDLGLSERDSDSAGAKERMARLRGLEDDDLGASIAAAAAGAARKDMLPDIEEINSTLTASSDRDGDETAEEFQEKRKRSGFRRGFSLTILLFAILALIYTLAPKIAEMMPALEPALDSYVQWVNTLRVATDNMMQAAVEKLTALLSQLSGGEGN